MNSAKASGRAEFIDMVVNDLPRRIDGQMDGTNDACQNIYAGFRLRFWQSPCSPLRLTFPFDPLTRLLMAADSVSDASLDALTRRVAILLAKRKSSRCV
jgi:hypothetical protein